MGDLVFPAECPGCGKSQQAYGEVPEFKGGYEPVPAGMRATSGHDDLIRLFRCRACGFATTPDAVWLDKPRWVAGFAFQWAPAKRE